jgi:small subunit ribosomal protein S6
MDRFHRIIDGGDGEAQQPSCHGPPMAVSPKEASMSARHYEVMVILTPDLEERTVQPQLDGFLNVIRQGGGSVDRIDVWGRRRMAYEIDKRAEGIYAVLDLTCTPEAVKELDRQLNLNEAVLRTKVVRPEAK